MCMWMAIYMVKAHLRDLMLKAAHYLRLARVIKFECALSDVLHIVPDLYRLDIGNFELVVELILIRLMVVHDDSFLGQQQLNNECAA